MTNKLSCLSTTTLIQLAHGEVLPDELHDIEEHVTDCESCRHSMQMAEDDPHWTNNILPVLKAPKEEVPPSDGPKVCADNESILRLLGPTDDPNMLGRIGSYEIAGIVGRGGMGIVFKAFDASLDRFVAIKVLLPHLAESGAARKRFSREAQAAAAVIDDHVLPIYGVDEWQGTPYLVTQYSRGMTLQKRIHEQGPLELKEILRIGLQTARGLAAAHAQGLVHRDVKPSNILLDGTVERALLTDFGLARAADDASVTRTGMVTGTPQYMSPEQVRGELVDARSDLFSLGSTLYAMCTGRSPFRADSTYGVMHRITEGAPSPIQQVNPEIPEWLCDVITKLMANRPNDRFESAQEVAELLEECLAHVQQPTAVPLPKRCLGLRKDFVTSNGQKATTAERSPVRRGLLLLTLGFVMCLAGVLIVLETGKGKLTIESEADSVPIRITQDGEIVKRLTVSKTGAGVRVAAGQYRVEIDGDVDGLAVNNGNTVTLERRGEEIVRIVYLARPLGSEPENAASGGDGSSNQDMADLEDVEDKLIDSKAMSNGFSGVYVVRVSPSKGETKLDLDRGQKFGPIVGPWTADLSFPMSADAPSSTVFALNSIVSALPNEDPWSHSLEYVRDRLATEKRLPALRLAGPRDELPKCFAFQTNAGAVGILSVDEIDPDTGNTTIRYRIRITNKAIVDFTQTPAHAADHAPRHFVRIVAGRDRLSFEGRETTWEELPRLLEQIQDRAATVLEVAIASDQLTLAEVGAARGRAEGLARRFGFPYSSYVGVHQPEVDAADRGGSDALDRGPATSTDNDQAMEASSVDRGFEREIAIIHGTIPREPGAREVVWGNPVRGLRVAHQLVPEGEAYSHGDTPKLTYHVQNVSNAPIHFYGMRVRQSDRCMVKVQDGQHITVDRRKASVGPVPLRYELKPGHQVILDGGEFGFDWPGTREDVGSFTLRCQPGTYQLSFEVDLRAVNSEFSRDDHGAGDLTLDTKETAISIKVNTSQPVFTQIQILAEALEIYKLDNGSYPPTKEGLRALVEKPADEIRTESWNGPYVQSLPTDAWGNAYA